MHLRARLFPLFLVLPGIWLWVTGCVKPTPVPLPPEEIVKRSASRMKGLSGFHFVIDRSGAPAFLDNEGTIAFRRAEGDFVSPDRAVAKIRVITPGLVAEISIVSIGINYWETNLLTGEWEELPLNMGFNPAVMFDPKIGFQPILESDLFNIKLVGNQELEETPGKLLYQLKGDLKGERLYEMSYGMIGPDQVSVQMWIAPNTFDLYRVVISDPPSVNGDATIWQVDFWNFGQAVTIVPPAVK